MKSNDPDPAPEPWTCLGLNWIQWITLAIGAALLSIARA